MQFAKWQGLGNDFILVSECKATPPNASELAAKLCDRHFGIGADGLVFILPSTSADIRMQIFNSDGSEAQMCGNATRCVARYVHNHRLSVKNELCIETLAGLIHTRLSENGSVTVNMGVPRLNRGEIPVAGDPEATAVEVPVEVAGHTYHATCVSTGVPHCVIFVDDLAKIDWQTAGRLLEVHPLFPAKTNVDFIQFVSKNELVMKVWERGAGVTLACGTGACASLVAGVLTGRTERKALIHLAGGDLAVEWDEISGNVYMTGPATESFSGEIRLEAD